MPAPVYARPLIIQPPADLRQQRPDLWRVSHELARQFANHKITVSEEFLQQVGQLLWQALGIDEAFEQARHAAGAQTLPMLLTSPDAAIQQLPWETLYHPTYGFLGKANGFTLARQRSAEVITNATTPERGPLRVLLFTALPDDVDAEHARLDIEEEQAQVLEALTPLVQEGMVRLEMPNDGRFSTLKQELQNFQPHLLFLSGHGKFLHPASREETPHALFLFEGENEGSNRVTESELATALLGSNVGCVVLSACESGMNASDNLTNGLAWRLNEIGIPYVIGMRESVLDRAGTLFVRQFCDAIAWRPCCGGVATGSPSDYDAFGGHSLASSRPERLG